MDKNLPEIVFSKSGPYTAVDIDAMTYLKGESVPVRRVMLLCRCGESGRRPFCDGTHEKVKLSLPERPARRRIRVKDYPGKEITIHFSLQVCSHAGVCYMKLPGVFDRGKKPWINPDGAPAQAIIDIIHRCPSGALSYSRGVDLVPCRKRPPKIVIIENGPFNIQGDVQLRDEEGTAPYNPEHYCLCRCGKSRNSPFCDGTHLGTEDHGWGEE